MSNVNSESEKITGSPAEPDAPLRTKAAPTIVGLVGGIAAGKSLVAAAFADLGARVINADVIAREVLESPDVCEKLRAAWGGAAFGPDQRPDRDRIAEIVFRHPEKLRALNAWVHPPTREKMKALLDCARTDPNTSLIVVDAPLLLEAGLDAWFDRILFVSAEQSVRADRVGKARAWTPDEISRREAAQIPAEEKRRRAHAVVHNNGTPEETRAQVARLFRQWTPHNPSPPMRTGGRNHA